MSDLLLAVLFVVFVGVVLVVGIRVGMLTVPRLERLSEPDEDPGGGDDTDDD